MEHNFSSPSLPFGYRLNTTCGWYITAPENHTVVLRLTYKLYLDSVEIYDVEGSVISLIARFTARLPLRSESTTIYSKFRRLYIVFESKVKTTDVEEEFYASYSAISLGMYTGQFYFSGTLNGGWVDKKRGRGRWGCSWQTLWNVKRVGF